MEPAPQVPEAPKRKTKSDIIAHSTIQEFVMSHAKPNGGFKSFLHSNLFAALLIWCLSQAAIVAAAVVTFYMRTSQLAEWKGIVDATIKRMDEQGTVHSHFSDESQDRQLAGIEPRLRRVEEDTRHIEVIESEHRRLTKDVEELRNGKK